MVKEVILKETEEIVGELKAISSNIFFYRGCNWKLCSSNGERVRDPFFKCPFSVTYNSNKPFSTPMGHKVGWLIHKFNEE